MCAKRLPWHQAVTGVQLRWEAWGIREESRVPVRLCLKKWGPLLVGAKPKQRAAREVSYGVSPLWKPIACVKHPLVSRLHREDELIRFSKSGSKSLKDLPPNGFGRSSPSSTMGPGVPLKQTLKRNPQAKPKCADFGDIQNRRGSMIDVRHYQQQIHQGFKCINIGSFQLSTLPHSQSF